MATVTEMGRVGSGVATVATRHLTKRYGDQVVVDDLSFDVHPGQVTGFLGPNGAGKTTTLRMMLGLTTPSSGEARVLGRAYRDLDQPLRNVGVLLDSQGFHPGRSARNHLRLAADLADVPRERVDELLELVDLTASADRAVGGFSTGMARRLGLATALVGDPRVLLLDEPANGLDPAGIAWLRQRLRQLAAEGRTVLVSSHVLAEMQQTVDHLVIIRAGRLVADAPLHEVLAGQTSVHVRTPEPGRLAAELEGLGAEVRTVPTAPAGTLDVLGLSAEQVGTASFEAGVRLFELCPRSSSLEETFLALTEETP